MRQGDHGFFYKFFRMTPQLFDKLLSFVAEDLTRQHHVREPLEPGERLAIALRFVMASCPYRNNVQWEEYGMCSLNRKLVFVVIECDLFDFICLRTASRLLGTKAGRGHNTLKQNKIN